MRFTSILCLFMLIVPLTSMHAQSSESLANKDDASRLCDDFLFQIEKSEMLSAIKLIREKTTQDESVLAELVTFLETAASKHGRLQGSDAAKKEEIGENIFRFTYALRYEHHPVWLQFYFYKIKDALYLKKIDWGEDMVELF